MFFLLVLLIQLSAINNGTTICISWYASILVIPYPLFKAIVNLLTEINSLDVVEERALLHVQQFMYKMKV